MPAAGRRSSLRHDVRRLPRAVWIVAGGSFLNRLGGFVVPFLVLYLVHGGYSAADAAVAVSAYALGKIVAGPVGGALTDRVGARRTTVLSMAASGVLTLALPLVHGLGPVVALAAAIGLA